MWPLNMVSTRRKVCPWRGKKAVSEPYDKMLLSQQYDLSNSSHECVLWIFLVGKSWLCLQDHLHSFMKVINTSRIYCEFKVFSVLQMSISVANLSQKFAFAIVWARHINLNFKYLIDKDGSLVPKNDCKRQGPWWSLCNFFNIILTTICLRL